MDGYAARVIPEAAKMSGASEAAWESVFDLCILLIISIVPADVYGPVALGAVYGLV